jgi:hypothetical protein
MINEVENQIDYKQHWNAKSGGNWVNMTGLTKCHKIRINKPIKKCKGQDKRYTLTEGTIASIGIKKCNRGKNG